MSWRGNIMLRSGIVSFLVFVTSSIPAFSQDSISISDFRYPETRAIDLKWGMSGSFLNSIDNVSYITSGIDSGKHATSSAHFVNGNIAADATFLMFHVNDVHTFDLNTSASFRYLETAREYGSSYNDNEEKDANLSVACSYLRYLGGDGPHFFGSYNLAYAFSYRQQSNSWESSERNVVFDDEGILGVGYGRIRDGTFVFQAVRIIERLREDGAIKSPLSHAQMVSLIDRIAHRREYTTNYERSEKYLVRDIVEELATSGAIDSNLVNAYSSLRVATGLRELIDTRFFGWRVAYGFGARGNIDRTSSYEGSEVDIQNKSMGDDFLHQFTAEFGHPLSLYTHLHSSLTVEFPRFRADLFTAVDFITTLTHQVGERFDVQLSYSFIKTQSTTARVQSTSYYREFTHTFSGSFVYFVEDQVSFKTSLSYMEDADYTTTPRFNRTSSFSFSFSMLYNII